jgi:hypothetical protein
VEIAAEVQRKEGGAIRAAAIECKGDFTIKTADGKEETVKRETVTGIEVTLTGKFLADPQKKQYTLVAGKRRIKLSPGEIASLRVEGMEEQTFTVEKRNFTDPAPEPKKKAPREPKAKKEKKEGDDAKAPAEKKKREPKKPPAGKKDPAEEPGGGGEGGGEEGGGRVEEL